jgi:subtilase family serine protease
VQRRRPPALVPLLLAAALSLLVAACGSNSSQSPTTSNSGSHPALVQTQQKAIRLSNCMRSHGLSSFPATTDLHAFKATLNPGSADARSPAFRSAFQACQHLLPGGVQPSQNAAGASASAASAPLNCAPPGTKQPLCYTPHAYQTAYGVATLLRQGINGSGETVVIPELPATPPASGIHQDLATFDTRFALSPAKLRIVNTIAHSKTPSLAGDEEVEDAEMVHAIAPGATLDIVLVPGDPLSNGASFAAAATEVFRQGVAVHAAVISISASEGEHSFTNAEVARMHAALTQAQDHHVTVVASSGDTGAISDNGPPVQVSLPASDPLVLAVGGTTLDARYRDGTYLGEMAWNGGSDATGGGFSSRFSRPPYQDGIARTRATRGVPDVAANADSNTAMAIEYSNGELRPATGTSASTPLWAGVIALADQASGRHLGFVNPAIYAIARSRAYHRAFHDVATGDNSVLWPTGVFTGKNAGPGWDPVTGWGSPDAQYLVPLLARAARAGA